MLTFLSVDIKVKTTERKKKTRTKTKYFLEYKALVGICDSSRASDLKLSGGNDI